MGDSNEITVICVKDEFSAMVLIDSDSNLDEVTVVTTIGTYKGSKRWLRKTCVHASEEECTEVLDSLRKQKYKYKIVIKQF